MTVNKGTFMGTKNYALLLTVLCSMSAFSQSTILGTDETKIIFQKMSNIQAADLALRSEVGTCRATHVGISGASYLYTLRHFEATWKMERFGAVSQIQSLPLAQVMTATVNYPLYVMPTFTTTDISSAKQQLGNKVKIYVATGKCGTVNFSSFNQSITTMKGKVAFFMENKILSCSAPDFVKRIRPPGSCTARVVQSPLPPATCRLLYQIESTKSGRNATAVAPSAPTLSPLTAEIKADFALDAVLSQNPDLAVYADAADIMTADHILPVAAIELIDNKVITAASFPLLTSFEKQILVNLIATFEVTKSNNLYIPFSPAIATIVADITANATAYAVANGLTASVYAIPKVLAVKEQLDLQLAPILAATGSVWSYNLSCSSEFSALSAPKTSNSL